jgi:glutaconate CoA-transferase subunit A
VADRADFRPVPDPFGGRDLLAVRALVPDVAIVHVQRADAEGNAHLWGNLGVSVEAARAARRVILTCEDIVAPEVIRRDPNRTLIPGFLVTAVVHVPHGAHPSPVPGYYDRDNAFYRDYHERTRADPAAWLEEWVHGMADHAAYLNKLGSVRLADLAVRTPVWSEPVNVGC